MTGAVRHAAGAVVWRTAPGSTRDLEVLVVHRPRHDDWTIPKGGVERGELLPVTAVREVEEETGVLARLGVPLSTLRYQYGEGKTKQVTYWIGTPVSGDPSTYQPNKEIDDVRWIPVAKASRWLSYDKDVGVVDDFSRQAALGTHEARVLMIARHAKARARERWRNDPLARPLSAHGKREAQRLAPVLAAYGAWHLTTSGALRCLQTLAPYAAVADRALHVDHRLDEVRDGGPRKPKPVRSAMQAARDHKRPSVVCGHRTVIPAMLAAVGVDAAEVEASPLPTAGLVVVHHLDGAVHDVERYDVR